LLFCLYRINKSVENAASRLFTVAKPSARSAGCSEAEQAKQGSFRKPLQRQRKATIVQAGVSPGIESSRGSQTKRSPSRWPFLFAFLFVSNQQICGKCRIAAVHCCEAERPQRGMQRGGASQAQKR
jgi:hypothetical protein